MSMIMFLAGDANCLHLIILIGNPHIFIVNYHLI